MARATPISSRQAAEIVRLVADGKSYREVSRETGLPTSAVRRIAMRHGLKSTCRSSDTPGSRRWVTIKHPRH